MNAATSASRAGYNAWNPRVWIRHGQEYSSWSWGGCLSVLGDMQLVEVWSKSITYITLFHSDRGCYPHFVEISTFHGYYTYFWDISTFRGNYTHFVDISVFRGYYPHLAKISMSRGYYPHFMEIFTPCGYYPYFMDISAFSGYYPHWPYHELPSS